MSTQQRIYLDHNATAPLAPVARDAVIAVLAEVGNPSSIHAEGRRMRDHVERARNQVARLLGRPREQIVFTSGGTEANALGVQALAAVAEQRGLARTVLTSRIEHPSLAGAVAALRSRGWQVVYEADVPVGVVALGLVNHELGTLTAIPRPPGALVHVDAVQAAGRLDLHAIDVDSLAISGHKLGAPQGVGALALRLDSGLPLIDGGHQERGRRPGTENVLGIVGFGAVAASVDVTRWAAVTALGEVLERGLRTIAGARIHGEDRARVGGTVNVGFAGARGESIVMALDLAGISVSTGAACTSGSVQPSAVLRGLGYSDEQAREAVRFSLGHATTAEQVEHVLGVLPAIVERARRAPGRPIAR